MGESCRHAAAREEEGEEDFFCGGGSETDERFVEDINGGVYQEWEVSFYFGFGWAVDGDERRGLILLLLFFSCRAVEMHLRTKLLTCSILRPSTWTWLMCVAQLFHANFAPC